MGPALPVACPPGRRHRRSHKPTRAREAHPSKETGRHEQAQGTQSVRRATPVAVRRGGVGSSAGGGLRRVGGAGAAAVSSASIDGLTATLNLDGADDNVTVSVSGGLLVHGQDRRRTQRRADWDSATAGDRPCRPTARSPSSSTAATATTRSRCSRRTPRSPASELNGGGWRRRPHRRRQQRHARTAARATTASSGPRAPTR